MNVFQRNAKLVVILACFAASTSAIFVRMAGDMPSLAVGFYRLTFAMPFFIISVLGWHRKELLSLSKKQVAGSVLAGLFLFFHFLSWFMGIVRTTVASAVVLASLHPVMILLITALVFREKTNIKVVAGVVAALIGAAIVTGGDYSFAHEALYGDFLALLAALFMALYFISGRRLRSGINTAVYVFLVFGSCWGFFTLGMLVTGTPFAGYSAESLLAIFAMAIVCQIGAHGLFNWSLGYVSPLYVATSETGEVLFASILAIIFFTEIPTFWQCIGGFVTVCGILIYNYFETKIQNVPLGL